MLTKAALQRFYKACQDKGLSPTTVKGYQSYLRHFEDEFTELPLDTPTIEAFLRKRREGPGHRGDVFKKLQAFYSWLAAADNIPSPVPSRGKVGRPPKHAPASSDESVQIGQFTVNPPNKLVGGGDNPSKYTSISTYQAVRAFLKRKETQGCTPKTITEYTHLLKRFMTMFPSIPLQPQQFDKFLNNPAWGKVTRWTYRRDLIAFYHFLEEFNYLPKDVFSIPKMKKEEPLPRFLSEEELRSVQWHTETIMERILLRSIIDSKLRIGELLSITRENLHPSFVRVNGKVGERQVPIGPDTYEMLSHLSPSGPLFMVNGRCMTPRDAYQILHNLFLKSGLKGKKLGPHVLRHTAAVYHIVEEGGERTLQQELGHTNPTMTAHYSHLAAGMINTKHQQLGLLNRLMPEERPQSGPSAKDTGDNTGQAGEGQNPQPDPPEELEDDAAPIRVGIATRKLF